MPGKKKDTLTLWYEADSKLLNAVATKYERVDKELFDRMIDLRELILTRLKKGAA